MFKIKNKKNRGISLVEVVIASSVLLAIVLSVIGAYNTYIGYALSNQNNTRASYLLEEGIEIINYLRDEGWTSNISPLVQMINYHFYFNGVTWSATTTPQYIDEGITRTFVIDPVNRDVNDDISVLGVNDPDTKKVTVTVSYWQGHSTSTQSLAVYITNLHDN